MNIYMTVCISYAYLVAMYVYTEIVKILNSNLERNVLFANSWHNKNNMTAEK